MISLCCFTKCFTKSVALGYGRSGGVPGAALNSLSLLTGAFSFKGPRRPCFVYFNTSPCKGVCVEGQWAQGSAVTLARPCSPLSSLHSLI